MGPVLDIQTLGYRGVGIGRHMGKVVMVPMTAPGDRVEVRITREHRHYDEAEVVRILEPSSFRQEPPCQYFGQCGGCQLQHIQADHQRALKAVIFEEMLTHQGIVPGAVIGDMLSTPEALAYRSRLEMHVLWRERPFLGFAARGSRDVVPVDRCILARSSLDPLLSDVCRLLEGARAEDVDRVELSCDAPGEGKAITLWASDRLPKRTLVNLAKLAPEVSALRGLYYAPRRGVEIRPLWEREPEISGVHYAVPHGDGVRDLLLQSWPGVFRQVNPSGNRLLITTVLDWIGEAAVHRILDLYAGMGAITLPASPLAREVVGVEVNPVAVRNARANAHRYGIQNIRWLRRSAKRGMQELLGARESFDTVVLDPPRSGAWGILDAIIELSPERILYISCDPPTLARDLKYLHEDGHYGVTRTRPLDMFPQTFHLESITLLRKMGA